MHPNTLIDSHQRRLSYLRVSITDRCNLNCIYCRPDGKIDKLDHKDILRYEELLRIIRVFVSMGVSKLRITGGEPLVRKEAFDFLDQLGTISGIKDISLTTNGFFLENNLPRLALSRIRRLNISLDSLKKNKFYDITGLDGFDTVWNAILKAHSMGFFPIKINVVVLRGINDDELTDFANLTHQYPFHVRFIEHMPIGRSMLFPEKPMLSSEIRNRIIKAMGALLPIDRNNLDGPVERYQLKGAKGEIGFISPISRHFCATCNRLRLTADGRLKPCLLSDYFQDLRQIVRQGGSDEDLKEIILLTVKNKPLRHFLSPDPDHPMAMPMSAIGG